MADYEHVHRLTPREQELAIWLAKPLTCAQIANELDISPKTVAQLTFMADSIGEYL